MRLWLAESEPSASLDEVQHVPDLSLGERLVKSPKLHFVDAGLACYLVGIHDTETLRRTPSMIVSKPAGPARGHEEGRRPLARKFRGARGVIPNVP